MIVVHDINKKQGKKFWSHLDVFSLCYVLLKKVAPIAPIAPISREYVRIYIYICELFHIIILFNE